MTATSTAPRLRSRTGVRRRRGTDASRAAQPGSRLPDSITSASHRLTTPANQWKNGVVSTNEPSGMRLVLPSPSKPAELTPNGIAREPQALLTLGACLLEDRHEPGIAAQGHGLQIALIDRHERRD